MATALSSSILWAAPFVSLGVAAPSATRVAVPTPSSAARDIRLRAQATYKVKLLTPEGEVELKFSDDTYILEQAEEEGMDLPYSCRAGSCSSCAAKVVSGEVDQPDQSFLNGKQVEEGWVLTCVAWPKSNLVIETHKAEELVASTETHEEECNALFFIIWLNCIFTK